MNGSVRGRRFILATILMVAVLGVLLGCQTPGEPETETAGGSGGQDKEVAVEAPESQRFEAFDFPIYLDWINVNRPLTMDELRGKIVVLDFWTYGCINCYHIIPKLNRLQEQFPEEVVVIGVHSAKFPSESFTANIRQAVKRYNMQYPVVNDEQMFVWGRYRIAAWPTVIVVDPEGYIVGGHAGEWPYDQMEQLILGLASEHDARGTLDRDPLPDLQVREEPALPTILSFPEELEADAETGRLFIADTGNHRIVEVDIESGAVLRTFGSGEAGHLDGSGEEAQFRRPKGMARVASELFVADTGNHAIRRIDLETGAVTTVRKDDPEMPSPVLRSPWDMAVGPDGDVYVAVAGEHQIWRLEPDTGAIDIVAGTGIEGVFNGPAAESQLAQPSGISFVGSNAFIADSESSGLRVLSLAGEPRVEGLIGEGLFLYGDVAGPLEEARMTHPKDVVALGNHLYVTDTYNNKVKRVRLQEGMVEDLAGGEGGYRDGSEALFDEPHGISHAGGTLYVADTNNHQIRTIDVATGTVDTLLLRNAVALEETSIPPRRIVLDEVRRIRRGEDSEAVLRIELPDGFTLNEGLNHRAEVLFEGEAFESVGRRENPVVYDIDASDVPVVSFPIPPAKRGRGKLKVRLALYYCRKSLQDVCFFDWVEIEQPLRTARRVGGPLEIDYALELPPELQEFGFGVAD